MKKLLQYKTIIFLINKLLYMYKCFIYHDGIPISKLFLGVQLSGFILKVLLYIQIL